ncbi:hypothetical protein [Ferrigenium sp. UT5]|uniref:hypothetical protein n=1 Tax=Ferrigenium sp. UT5 TaxID=3242105 RepID=UPI0035537D81
MNPFELHKTRILKFISPEQAEQARQLLVGLNDFTVESGPEAHCLRIRYSVEQYSLEGLQKALTREGFTLETSPFDRMKHALYHYCEDVQYHNLKTPEPRTKNNSQEVFIKAYGQQQHGDQVDAAALNGEVKP